MAFKGKSGVRTVQQQVVAALGAIMWSKLKGTLHVVSGTSKLDEALRIYGGE